MRKNEHPPRVNQTKSRRFETGSDRCPQHHRRNGGTPKIPHLQQSPSLMGERSLPQQKESRSVVQWIDWKMRPTWQMECWIGHPLHPLHQPPLQPHEFPHRHHADHLPRKDFTFGQHVPPDQRISHEDCWIGERLPRKWCIRSWSDPGRCSLVTRSPRTRRLPHWAKTKGTAPKTPSCKCGFHGIEGQEDCWPVWLPSLLHHCKRSNPHLHCQLEYGKRRFRSRQMGPLRNLPLVGRRLIATSWSHKYI